MGEIQCCQESAAKKRKLGLLTLLCEYMDTGFHQDKIGYEPSKKKVEQCPIKMGSA